MQRLTLLAWLLALPASAAEFGRDHFEKTVEAIRANARVELTDEEIYKAAVDGVLQHLDAKDRPPRGTQEERANTLLDPRTVTELKKDLAGKVTGIGVVLEYDPVQKKQRYPLITKVVPTGGAVSAGVKSGDEILAIDGRPVAEFASFREIVYALRGKEKSKVELSLLRDASIVKANVERKIIPYEPVQLVDADQDIPVLVVNYFNEKTKSLIEAKLANVSSARGLVLDMRQCGGGGLHDGIEVLEVFTPANQVMLQMASRDETKVFRTKKAGRLAQLPLAVIVSQETRSMCEAFAYSVRETRGAMILGEVSHGKATVETLYEVGDGYSAKFTSGQLLGPDGNSWQVKGVEPDIAVSLDHAEQAARRFFRK